MRFAYLVVASWCLLAVAAAGVRAEEPQYKEMVRQAVEEYRAGRFDEAAAFFGKAHAIRPSARTHRGLGLAYFEASRYALALRHLRAALNDERRPLTPEQREVVTKAVEQAQAIVARYQVRLEPPGARLEVDGSPAYVQEGELLLDPGRHEIAATAPGYRRERRMVDARGGASLDLVIELEPETEGAATAEPEEQPLAEDEEGAEESTGGALDAEPGADADDAGDSAGFAEGRLWTWVALGGAGAFGAAALVFGLIGNAQYDDLMTKCEEGCSEQQIEQEIDDSGVQSSQLLTNVSLALSGVFLAGAVVLYFVEGPADTESPTMALGLGPGGARLTGRF